MNVNDNVPGSPQTVALTGAATDFSLTVATGGSASATIGPGQAAKYDLALTPIGGFTGSIAIGCAGAPATAACTASASPIAVNSAAPIPFSLDVTTASTALAPPFVIQRFDSHWRLSPVAIKLLLFAFVNLTLMALYRRRPARFSLRAAGLSLAMLLVSCAGGPGTQSVARGTPAGTYTLTATGTQQGATRSLNLTLTVQ